jgi:hypothetical protein
LNANKGEADEHVHSWYYNLHYIYIVIIRSLFNLIIETHYVSKHTT